MWTLSFAPALNLSTAEKECSFGNIFIPAMVTEFDTETTFSKTDAESRCIDASASLVADPALSFTRNPKSKTDYTETPIWSCVNSFLRGYAEISTKHIVAWTSNCNTETCAVFVTDNTYRNVDFIRLDRPRLTTERYFPVCQRSKFGHS